MRIRHHAKTNAKERMGIDLMRFNALMAARRLTLPDGEHQTEFGTLVVRDGTIITALGPEMSVVRRKHV